MTYNIPIALFVKREMMVAACSPSFWPVQNTHPPFKKSRTIITVSTVQSTGEMGDINSIENFCKLHIILKFNRNQVK